MKFLRQIILGIGAAALLARPFGARADVTNATPDFKEVYGLIRAHVAGETEAELNRAATLGLLTELHSKVRLLSGPVGSVPESDAPLLAKSALYDGPIGYLRVGRVDDGLADRIKTAYQELSGSNQLEGLVLDLRFADSHDYAAAVAVAGLFLSKETPLLDWGDGLVNSKSNPDALTLPLTILVNHKTAAAAEALAAMMHETGRALVLGNTTAGEAAIDQEFPLDNGQRLLIATSAVKLGNGETLSANGITPDIQVTVSLEHEKAYLLDPYAEIATASTLGASADDTVANSGNTNRGARTRITEADLIRLRKARPGKELDEDEIPPLTPQEAVAEKEKPFVRDPVLGRALDLIKGISLLNSSH